MKKQATNIINHILFESLTQEEIYGIVKALKVKKYVSTVIFPNTAESIPLKQFLIEFWTYDKSPYVKEKLLVGQKIHQRYTKIMLSRAKHYIIPVLGAKPIGTITRDDIKKIIWNLKTTPQKVNTRKRDSKGNIVQKTQMLSSETVNQIARSITCPLRWAYNNGMIKKNICSDIFYCPVEFKERKILPDEVVKKLFSAEWKNADSKLANLIAMCTGMRSGEIRALQIQDIGKDRIFVRHNFERTEGLKLPKNGHTREIIIPPALQKLIQNKIGKNPYNLPDSFIFFTDNPLKPVNPRHWNENLHSVLKSLNVADYKEYTFHSWRHFFASNMASHTDERKVRLVTGHKSKAILERYTNHQDQETLKELGALSQQLFEPYLTH